MKKLFTLVLACVMSLAAMAEEYTCGLAVVLNGQPSPYDQITISCTKNANGKYDILLPNFYFGGEDGIPVGDIEINDIDATGDDEITEISAKNKDVKVGLFGTMPADIEATLKDNDLQLQLHLVAADVDVKVALTSISTQIYGCDFEDWHTATASNGTTTSDEPNGWHSFMSCTGAFASIVDKTPHIFISDDVPAETESTKSVKIVSSSVFGSISANGTITTGRMKAGAMSAADPNNCAFLDITKTDEDGNGDLFANNMKGTPASISMWYKFKNGKGNTKPASLRAVITDGTYYQDPADAEYKNVVAVAEDNTNLTATDGEWKYVTIPFDYLSYVENEAEAKAILVTISTCAEPGGGSIDATDVDELYVDEVTLNYPVEPIGLTIFNTDIKDFSADKYEYDLTVNKLPMADDIDFSFDDFCTNVILTYYDDKAKKLFVNLYNEELTESRTYTFNVTIDTAVKGITSDAANRTITGRYNANGQKVGNNAKGLVITRFADGTAVKSMK